MTVDRTVLAVGTDLPPNALDGLEVEAVPDAESARDRLPAVDCVVSAHDLPATDGVTFLESVRESYPHFPFVLAPADGDESLAAAAVAADASEYVPREDAPDRLEAAVEDAIETYRERRRRRTVVDHLESVSDGFLVLDREWRITYANAEAARLLGREQDDLVGEIVWEEFPGATDLEFYDEAVRAMVEQEPVTFEERCPSLDAWFEVDIHPSPEGLSVHFVDVTGRKATERALRREQDIVGEVIEELDDVFALLDTDCTFRRWNDELLAVTGHTGEEIASARPTDLAPEDQRDRVEDALEQVREGGSAVVELDLRTGDGDARPYEFTVSGLEDEAGELIGIAAIGRDITDRVERERTLKRLHTATRELLEAETEAEVGDIAVSAAEDVLDLTLTAIHRWDESEDALVPVAWTGPTEELLGDPPRFESGEGIAWGAFASGETLALSDVREHEAVYNPETDIRSEIFLPLGEHGVFLTGSTTVDAFDESDVELAEILAANVTAALDRIERESELHARERRLREQTEELLRLDRVNEVVRGIAYTLMGASTREEVEQSVCDRLVEVDGYRFAWIGSWDADQAAASPRAWAGSDESFLDAVIDVADSGADLPAAVACRENRAVLGRRLVSDPAFEPVREAAFKRGFRSAISVPLVEGSAVYGVVEIYADSPAVFTRRERATLAELGEIIGYVLRSVERRQARLTGDSVEVELTTGAGDTLSRLARRADARIELVGLVPTSESAWHVYVVVEGADPESFREAAARYVSIEDTEFVHEDEDGLHFELQFSRLALGSFLSEYGGILESLSTDGDTARLTVDLPGSTDVRAFVEACRDRFEGVELIARRERSDKDVLSGALLDRLTERQAQAIKVAYHQGFFEWPRERTGEEVAETLDVAPATFHQHLRKGLGAILESVVPANGRD